jgi:hypothetical protein
MKKINLILGILIFVLSSCSDSSNSSSLDSDNYDTKEERVEVLKKEIKSFSDFENAEFKLFNVNGFSNSRTTVPGASSWDYKFAIKVNTLDVNKWINGMIEVETDEHNAPWIKEIIQQRQNEWITNSEPKLYTRNADNVMVIVHHPEGIIFKRVINN